MRHAETFTLVYGYAYHSRAYRRHKISGTVADWATTLCSSTIASQERRRRHIDTMEDMQGIGNGVRQEICETDMMLYMTSTSRSHICSEVYSACQRTPQPSPCRPKTCKPGKSRATRCGIFVHGQTAKDHRAKVDRCVPGCEVAFHRVQNGGNAGGVFPDPTT